MIGLEKLIIVAILGYFFGSFNFAIIISKFHKGKDVRELGSGNAGGTNMLRNFGLKWGIITVLCDGLKCVISIFTARAIMPGNILAEMIAATFCIAGHCYPIFFKFKGGKGVAVTATMLAVVDWRLFIISAIVFFVIAGISQYASLASMTAAVVNAIASIFVRSGDYVFITWCFGIALFIIFLHRDNIKRLINKTENKLTFKRKR